MYLAVTLRDPGDVTGARAGFLLVSACALYYEIHSMNYSPSTLQAWT